MTTVRKVDMTGHVLDIRVGSRRGNQLVDHLDDHLENENGAKDWSMQVRATQPGRPERIDGMTIGIVTLTQNPPHGGELHPDGDEFLYVISGKLQLITDSSTEPVEVGPGEGCIVPQGEWHKVDVLEPTQLMYVNPGPNAEHRPL